MTKIGYQTTDRKMEQQKPVLHNGDCGTKGEL